MTNRQEYIEAAKKQAKIAEYFYEQLNSCYHPQTFGDGEENDIKTQAYFEGCVRAVYSCLDKLCNGQLKGENADELGKKLKASGLTSAAAEADLILKLKRLRNDVTHNYTDKSSNGDLVINVKTKDGTKLGDIKALAECSLQIAKQSVCEVNQ